MNKKLERDALSADLEAIDIRASAVDDLNEKLYALGFSKSVLFPDLDSLVVDIKRDCGVTSPIPRETIREIPERSKTGNRRRS